MAGGIPDSPPGPAWTLSDFLFAALAGFAGALVAGAAAALVADTGLRLVIITVGQYGGHLLGLLYVVRRHNSTLAALGLEIEPIDGLYVIFGIALQFAVALLFSPLAVWLEVEGAQQAVTEVIPEVTGTTVRVVIVLAIALVAPVVEETMFRGLLMRTAERWWGPGWALVATSLVFALFHLLGIASWRAAALLIPQLFVVGLILGRQAQRHGRLGVAIFTHAGFNLVAVLTLFLAPEMLGG